MRKNSNFNPFLLSQNNLTILLNSKIYGAIYGAQLLGGYCNDKINEPMTNYYKKSLKLPHFTASLLLFKE